MPKIEEDGKSWLRRPKLYKGVIESYKKKNSVSIILVNLLSTQNVIKANLEIYVVSN